MSKNIYRVNKKSDLDEIIKNNFYKPICITFVSKSSNPKLYNDITVSLLAISKVQTYNLIVVIDFDDFIDNINYFSSIRSNLPYFISYFKGKNINGCENSDNFIPIITSLMEQIHSNYLNKLTLLFSENKDKNEKNNILNKNQNNKNNQNNDNLDDEIIINNNENNKNDVLNNYDDLEEDVGINKKNLIIKDNYKVKNINVNDDVNDDDNDDEDDEEEEEEEEEEEDDDEEEDGEEEDDNEDEEEINTKNIEKLKKLKELKNLKKILEK